MLRCLERHTVNASATGYGITSSIPNPVYYTGLALGKSVLE